jgi:hypothetical protein
MYYEIIFSGFIPLRDGLHPSAETDLSPSSVMRQASLAKAVCELVTERMRDLLDQMNLVVPWAELLCLIQPHALRARQVGLPFPRRPSCAFTACNSGSA